MATSILRRGRLLTGYGSTSHLHRPMTRLAHGQHPPGFYIWNKYFTDEEQKVLAAASLYKLDSLENRQARKKRNNYWMSNRTRPNNLISMFAPDDLYEFEEARTYQLSNILPLMCIYRVIMMESFINIEKCTYPPGQ